MICNIPKSNCKHVVFPDIERKVAFILLEKFATPLYIIRSRTVIELSSIRKRDCWEMVIVKKSIWWENFSNAFHCCQSVYVLCSTFFKRIPFSSRIMEKFERLVSDQLQNIQKDIDDYDFTAYLNRIYINFVVWNNNSFNSSLPPIVPNEKVCVDQLPKDYFQKIIPLVAKIWRKSSSNQNEQTIMTPALNTTTEIILDSKNKKLKKG